MKKTKSKIQCSEQNFVGNRLESSLDIIGPDKKTLREKYLVGPPRDCPMGDSKEMKRRGFIGLYEKSPRRTLPVSKLNALLSKAVAEW